MAKSVSRVAVPKEKLPSTTNTKPKAPKLASTGLGAYLQQSKLGKTPKAAKNGMGAIGQ